MAERASYERGWFADQMLALVDAEPSFVSSLEKQIDRPAIRAYAMRLKAQAEAEKRAAAEPAGNGSGRDGPAAG
ncbi:hypothetical protein ACTZWW_09995 [Salinarimonas sp. NSM]|uniref:hypothetical protein n=1 Tax=Salinarimonas sp. NSM TaxID=3458003 RepID=UPI00403577F9